MIRTVGLLLVLLGGLACGDNTLVVVNRLAPGGGVAGNGDTFPSGAFEFVVLVKIESDATEFNPGDLMRLLVDGVDRTDEVVIGGEYALLPLEPRPPNGTPLMVELFRRTGPVLDTATLVPVAFAGPTLDSVAPDRAQAGAQVTITGTGFDAGPVRVFFGGIEGTVDASDATTITATVPDGARPGLVYVQIDGEAAEGLVGFQPLDVVGDPIPFADDDTPQLFGAFPSSGGVETPVRIYGINFTDDALPRFLERFSTRVFDIRPFDLPGVGEILCARAVVFVGTPAGDGAVSLREFGRNSNELPFRVDGP